MAAGFRPCARHKSEVPSSPDLPVRRVAHAGNPYSETFSERVFPFNVSEPYTTRMKTASASAAIVPRRATFFHREGRKVA